MNFSAIFKLSIASIFAIGLSACQTPSEKLVIVHTNDTHSQISPKDDSSNMGGAGRRLALFDSIRAAEPATLFVDAGDAVQGTLFFNLYGGVVEQKVMNALGYDIRIIGNHEFDNGVDSLAKILALSDAEILSSNYDLSKTPLADIVKKTTIKTYGKRKVGFMAINLAPEGLVAPGNYDNVVYIDLIETANETAKYLKDDMGCDVVVAITHIGYKSDQLPGDEELARQSTDIDIIIGGHSHDTIDPKAEKTYDWFVPNADGKNVLVTQTGKSGVNIGKITIDLETLALDYELIPVDKRLDNRIPESFNEMIAPYCIGVDSLMKVPVGTTVKELDKESTELLNWCADVVYERGSELADDIDLALFNKGGIRRGLPQDTITEGQVISMLPFSNYIQVIAVKGEDLYEAICQMARVDGNGISKGVKVEYIKDDKNTNDFDESEVLSVTINGKPIYADHVYRIATIDYLANGGDYMSSLTNHTLLAQSPVKVFDDVLNYIRKMNFAPISPDSTVRMISKQ